jgi:hypothetical protein
MGAFVGVDGAIVLAGAQVKHERMTIAFCDHTHISFKQEGITHTPRTQGNNWIVVVRVNLNHLIIPLSLGLSLLYHGSGVLSTP